MSESLFHKNQKVWHCADMHLPKNQRPDGSVEMIDDNRIAVRWDNPIKPPIGIYPTTALVAVPPLTVKVEFTEDQISALDALLILVHFDDLATSFYDLLPPELIRAMRVARQ